MRYHQQSAGPAQHAIQCQPYVFRIERRKAFIEDHYFRILQQRPGNINSAAFSVGELPARFPHHLQHSCRHLIKEGFKTEFTTDFRRFPHIFFAWRPTAPHQKVEREGLGEYVILVELRGGHNSLAPALLS